MVVSSYFDKKKHVFLELLEEIEPFQNTSQKSINIEKKYIAKLLIKRIRHKALFYISKEIL